MNKYNLSKMEGFRLKLCPLTVRFNSDGKRLPSVDDIWIVDKASQEKIKIGNRRTDHILELAKDAIHDFRECVVERQFDKDKQGILKLLGFVQISGNKCEFKPLSLPIAELLYLKQINLF